MNKTIQLLENILSKERVKGRLIDRVSYASDAGFYHLVPKVVVHPVDEQEIVRLFLFSRAHNIPLTFRAAGTSLSGQAVGDGILVELSRWKKLSIEKGGALVRIQPGVIGGIVNAHLRQFKRKIGPDPASISAAMIGGIVSNNSSGMCCGVHRNSYHTVKYIRFILPEGAVYTTECMEDYIRFKSENPALSAELSEIRKIIVEKESLKERIRGKYLTKNTVGYSMNAFVDFEEPLDIFAHLLVGSEGTLAFISEVVMDTFPDLPHKWTGLLFFRSIHTACQAIMPLKDSGAEAIELMDRASLRSIEHLEGVPRIIKTLDADAAALLVEYQAITAGQLEQFKTMFDNLTPNLGFMFSPEFTSDISQQAILWKVRKGMFPSVGAVRKSGTSVVLEDIAFPVESLGAAILDLQLLFKKYDYREAIIFGHAKDGNIHFVITQSFGSDKEIVRYDAFLKEVVLLVVDKYHGTLKAEHGTGRNMSPFVEKEWGEELYILMCRLKKAVDPRSLLNPGVIINEDPFAHITHLKDLPTVDMEVDRCMECGFCEPLCPSNQLTMSPRRRIVARRELTLLREKGEFGAYKELLKEYQYDGMDTCAVDGLCAIGCPVGINTGDLVKRLRSEKHSVWGGKIANVMAGNFQVVGWGMRAIVRGVNSFDRIFGKEAFQNLTADLRKLSTSVPLWNSYLKPSDAFPYRSEPTRDVSRQFLYIPSCISRNMGGSMTGKADIVSTLLRVAQKTGYELIIPEGIQRSCCGQIFSSKGFKEAYGIAANKMIELLWSQSSEGRFPIVMDLSSCTQTLLDYHEVLTEANKKCYQKLLILDSVDFLLDYVFKEQRSYRKKEGEIVLHVVCSLRKLGKEDKLIRLARLLAEKVYVPVHTDCCGMAGDRGFWFPELTLSATSHELCEVKEGCYSGYYSTSRTCEANLSLQINKSYESIIYLADEVLIS